MSLRGGLTLQRAVIGSRMNGPETAYGQLERASQIAAVLEEGRNRLQHRIRPGQRGAVYEIAVAVELGDAGRARQPRVDTTGLSGERRARMLIDVARAHAQRRQLHEAVAVLREAEKNALDQVRSHDLIRQLVSDLLTMQDAPASELRDLVGLLTVKT
jgi:hypothetical protein